MASISSTSGSNSLGNTALRGFGGMVSGIDRDSIVEQMTPPRSIIRRKR